MICGCLLWISFVIDDVFIYFRFLMLLVLLFDRMWLMMLVVWLLFSVLWKMVWMYLFEFMFSGRFLVLMKNVLKVLSICLCDMFFSVVMVVFSFCILCGLRCLSILVVLFLFSDIMRMVLCWSFLVFICYLFIV